MIPAATGIWRADREGDSGGAGIQITPGLLITAAVIAFVVLVLVAVALVLVWRKIKGVAGKHQDLVSAPKLNLLAQTASRRRVSCPGYRWRSKSRWPKPGVC